MNAVRNITKMGTDVRQIARLLQKKAPPGHKLAYINDEEAEVLRSRGGSGRITESGVPSYELDDPSTLQGGDTQPVTEAPIKDISATYGGETSGTPPTDNKAPTTAMDNPPLNPLLSGDAGSSGIASVQATSLPPQNVPTPSFPNTQSSAATPAGMTAEEKATQQAQQDFRTSEILAQNEDNKKLSTPPPGYSDKLMNYLQDPKFAVQGAGGIAQALIASNMAKKSRESAQAASQDTKALAAPYQAQGAQMQQAAQRGELNPQGQQAIQAAQAQAAQAVSSRGGVGGIQAQQQIENMRQSLLSNQMNMGLQLQQVGDKIAIGAIQAGVQADQYINQLTASFAQNIARTVYGTPTGTKTPPD